MNVKHLAKRGQAITLIKKVSDLYGGDDPIFLTEYVNDILYRYSIDKILTCFTDLKGLKSCIAKNQ